MKNQADKSSFTHPRRFFFFLVRTTSTFSYRLKLRTWKNGGDQHKETKIKWNVCQKHLHLPIELKIKRRGGKKKWPLCSNMQWAGELKQKEKMNQSYQRLLPQSRGGSVRQKRWGTTAWRTDWARSPVAPGGRRDPGDSRGADATTGTSESYWRHTSNPRFYSMPVAWPSFNFLEANLYGCL